MAGYDRGLIDDVRRNTLSELVRALLARDGLTLSGLLVLRGRLDPTSREFLSHGELEDLRTEVDLALSEKLGVDLDDLPGRGGGDGVPDDWT